MPNGPGVASGSPSPSIQVSPTSLASASPLSALATCSLSGAPDARMAASAAYDPSAAHVVLFGGDRTINGGNLSTAETWIWNGAMWTLYAGDGPSARAYAAMDYDAAHREIVLYGGQHDVAGSSPISSFDTWVWDGSKWLNSTPALTPKLRQPAGAFDVARSAFVVFGIGASGPETWLWNGSQWAMTNPAHTPSARTGEHMAFVTTSKQVLLFGGYASGLGYLSDTWIWDGVDWHEPTLSDAPSGRVSPTLVSGPQVVLFGGGGGRGPLGDDWSWDGSQWTRVASQHFPSAREAAAGASDGQSVLIVGGDSGAVLSDEWRWDGSDWTQC